MFVFYNDTPLLKHISTFDRYKTKLCLSYDTPVEIRLKGLIYIFFNLDFPFSLVQHQLGYLYFLRIKTFKMNPVHSVEILKKLFVLLVTQL